MKKKMVSVLLVGAMAASLLAQHDHDDGQLQHFQR